MGRNHQAENKLPKHYCRRSLTPGFSCIMEPWIAASSSLLGYRHVGMGSEIRFRYDSLQLDSSSKEISR